MVSGRLQEGNGFRACDHYRGFKDTKPRQEVPGNDPTRGVLPWVRSDQVEARVRGDRGGGSLGHARVAAFLPSGGPFGSGGTSFGGITLSFAPEQNLEPVSTTSTSRRRMTKLPKGTENNLGGKEGGSSPDSLSCRCWPSRTPRRPGPQPPTGPSG
jgi:hypothetical protein